MPFENQKYIIAQYLQSPNNKYSLIRTVYWRWSWKMDTTWQHHASIFVMINYPPSDFSFSMFRILCYNLQINCLFLQTSKTLLNSIRNSFSDSASKLKLSTQQSKCQSMVSLSLWDRIPHMGTKKRLLKPPWLTQRVSK